MIFITHKLRRGAARSPTASPCCRRGKLVGTVPPPARHRGRSFARADGRARGRCSASTKDAGAAAARRCSRFRTSRRTTTAVCPRVRGVSLSGARRRDRRHRRRRRQRPDGADRGARPGLRDAEARRTCTSAGHGRDAAPACATALEARPRAHPGGPAAARHDPGLHARREPRAARLPRRARLAARLAAAPPDDRARTAPASPSSTCAAAAPTREGSSSRAATSRRWSSRARCRATRAC